MSLPIKPVCSPKKIRKDGTAPIFLQYCYSPTNLKLLNTGIYIPPDCWNRKLSCVTKKLPAVYGNHERLNQELFRLKRITEDVIALAVQKQVTDKGAFVKKYFSPKLSIDKIEENEETLAKQKAAEKKAKADIYFQLDEYIKSKERKVSKATLCVYKNVKAHLLAFEKYRGEKLHFKVLILLFMKTS